MGGFTYRDEKLREIISSMTVREKAAQMTQLNANLLTTDENGNSKIRSRNERIKRLDDDLPKISKAYKLFLEEGKV